MARFRKVINTILSFIIIVGLSYCTYNFISAESRMRAACSKIQPGMTIESLQAFISAHDLFPQPQESGVHILTETNAYGRFRCKLTTNAGVVKEVVYSSID